MRETKEKKEQKKISTSSEKTVKNSKKTQKINKEVKSKKVVSSSTKRNYNTVKNAQNAVSTYSEYYDLPYRYNQTVIKILAQTPHALFVYWDISNADRAEMINKYGDNFFNDTKPVLLVHNKTLRSSFEVEIDDFTNSWYLRTPTSNCVFEIELGRKKYAQNKTILFENNSDYLHITKSNTLESPNDRILKDNLNTVYFKNVKNNNIEKRNISNYNLNNVYNLIELHNNDGYNLENNPSSGFKIS